MKSLRQHFNRYVATVVTCVILSAGCNNSSDVSEKPETEAAVSKTVATAPKRDLVYPLPESDTEKLLDFINEMAAREPVGENDEERTKDVGHMMQSRIAASEALLELPDGKEFAGMAARTKLESLRVLQMIGETGAEEAFNNYANEIASSDDSEIASVGQIGLFQSMIDATMNQQGDAQQAIDAYQQLVDSAGKTEPVFFAGQEAAMMLQRSGNIEAASSLLTKLSKTFANHENEQIAAEALAAGRQTKLLDFDAKLRELLMEGGDHGDDLTALAHEVLSGDSVQPTALGMIMQAAQQLEYSGHVENAQALYSKAEAATEGTEFEQQIATELEDAKTRLGLIGEPFEITGQLANGESFAWSDYEGKVVLVDFWATWCGPCLREVPNVKKNYARFKDQGFDVVSVNLDSELETVQEFLEKQPLPWATVVGEDESELGFENPNAVRCGVKAIPFLVLVGQDGNVAALHVRDKLLEEKLIELLGEPEEEVLEISDPDAEAEPETEGA